MRTMDRYVPPVNPLVYPHLATVLLGIGAFFTTWFFVFVVSRPKTTSKERRIFKELLLGLCASIFLGIGAIFFMLSVGIYI